VARSRKVFETAGNTYTASDPIGNGGAGTVYLVKDVDGHEYALKCLTAADSTKRKRFSRELSFCQKTRHENIVEVLDTGLFFDGDKRLPFYVMPLYKGTLRAVVKQELVPGQVLPLFDQILSGVEAAHLLGVYHRDLKPENILYDPAKSRLVVADFGIAHFEQENLLTAEETKDQERLANFTYAAPEQRVRGVDVDHRADIFALGLMLNEMFTGSVPLAQGYPLIAGVSPPHAYLDEIVGRMIQYSAASRYPTVAKIKEELLARGQVFVTQQKVDELSRKVVPATTPDDPLGGQDVKIVDIAYEPRELIFSLNPAPPVAWQNCFKNLPGHGFIAGLAEPQRVRFLRNSAVIGAREQLVEQIVPLFRSWVSLANEDYREYLKKEADKERRTKLAALQVEQARAAEKARVAEKLLKLL
jgi:serine/threonine protein kinase